MPRNFKASIFIVIFHVYVLARSLPVYVHRDDSKSYWECSVTFHQPTYAIKKKITAGTIFINPEKIVCKSNNGPEKYFKRQREEAESVIRATNHLAC